MRRAVVVRAGSALLGGGLVADDVLRHDGNKTAGFVRLSRSCVTAAAVAVDYWMLPSQGELREKRLVEAHKRGARRLLELCERNGGLYIKLGQHLAQLEYVIPMEYCEALSPLLRACRPRSIDSVRSVLSRELSADAEAIFESFSLEPIAVASLAQVHTATLKGTGQKVAVKVQHEGLREAASADIFTVTTLVNLAHRIFPNFDFRWLAEETAQNLPEELDFRHEGENNERCRRDFGGRTDVVTPDVLWSLTTPRVLTMSFEEGCHVLDVDTIRGMGVDPKDVSRILSRTFAEQIFVHGFLHCDPHGGNVLVRPHPHRAGKPQLVLLDHGLYKELSEGFRLNYARLWHGIVVGDVDEIRSSADYMGADGEKFRLLTAMLTLKSWNQITGTDEKKTHRNRFDQLEQKFDEDEVDQLREYAEEYFEQISQLLATMPRPLLLVLKTNDNLRSVDRALGAPINTLTITAQVVSLVLEDYERAHASGNELIALLKARSRTFTMQVRIILFRMVVTYTHCVSRLRSMLFAG